MAKRNGVSSLVQVAKRLCSLIVNFSPIIAREFPSNTALQTALAAALAACQALSDELAAVQDFGV
jgi:hypothetical protein